MNLTGDGIDLQPMSSSDASYLYDLSVSTMQVWVEQVWGKWEEPFWRTFIADALNHSAFNAVMRDGFRVGALAVQEHDSHLLLELLCVESQHQNHGVGGAVVRKILDNARKDARHVKLRVLRPNPAKRLYERLGFVVTESTSERYLMEHR